jgi:acyl CoA:acetate/3-ketoacid CoA transferase alpha subunit
MIGKRYGKLTVIEQDCAPIHEKWFCLCDCGAIKSLERSYISQNTKNKTCGCVKEKAA